MKVSEINNRRFDVALELLQEGSAFTFDGICFWISPEGSLLVSAYSRWHISNITEQNALSDLERAKNVFTYLVTESSVFAIIVKNCPLNFSLVYDCGESGAEVARLVNDKVIWAKGMSF